MHKNNLKNTCKMYMFLFIIFYEKLFYLSRCFVASYFAISIAIFLSNFCIYFSLNHFATVLTNNVKL